MSRRSRSLVWLSLAFLVACGAGPDDPVPLPGPGELAATLLEVTSLEEPPEEKLALLFDPNDLTEGRSSLLESLAALPADPRARILAVERPSGGDTAYVDLGAALAGGGTARLTVRLSADALGAWKVTWFQGPDVEWPASRTRHGTALSTSSPPGTGSPR